MSEKLSVDGGCLNINQGDGPETTTTVIKASADGVRAVIFDRAAGKLGLASNKSIIDIPIPTTAKDLTELLSHLPETAIGPTLAYINGEDINNNGGNIRE